MAYVLFMFAGISPPHKGSIESFVLSCPSLAPARQKLADFKANFLNQYPDIVPLVQECVEADPVQFWIDCSTMSAMISAVQRWGEGVLFCVLKLTRNYCHSLHLARMKLRENSYQ